MTYNEYWQVIDAGLGADELITYKYEDQGVATLEDGCMYWKKILTIRLSWIKWPALCALR
jgi:hypothetical protein